MKAVVGLLVMLLKVSQGVETCDGRQDGAQCLGALGGTVVLRLMDNASEISSFQWLKEGKRAVLKWRNDTLKTNEIANRSSFTASNGTFRINDLSSTDDGKYILTIYDSDGILLKKWTLQLNTEAPVSSVRLVSECLSQGEVRASCSSEGGDSPQYSWTLDGLPLIDAQLLYRNKETENITLKQDVLGELVCTVRNRVSSSSDKQIISTCGFTFVQCISSNGTFISMWVPKENNTLCIQTTTVSTTISEGKETDITVSNKPSTNITSSNQTPSTTDDPWYIKYLTLMAGILSALVILLLVGVAIVCSHKKKQINNPIAIEDEQELTYADVRIVQRQVRQMQQRAEEEVEYGQVKFSNRPQQSGEPRGEDCVYAKVRKGR